MNVRRTAQPWFRRRRSGQGWGWNVASRDGAAVTLAFVAVAGLLAMVPIMILGETGAALTISTGLIVVATLMFIQVARTHSD